MRKRIALSAAAVLATALAAVVSATAASAARPTPAPLDASAAAALAAAGTTSGSSGAHRVKPEEALAAAAVPGATVWVEPSLSLDAAVGVAAAPSAVVAATTLCWANSLWTQWGTWPYEQKITDTTYWCAVYGDHITYRSSSVAATGTICGTNWTTSQLVAGGIGYSWFTMRSSAGWSCPTAVPWIVLHPSHYEDVARNDWGSTELVRTG